MSSDFQTQFKTILSAEHLPRCKPFVCDIIPLPSPPPTRPPCMAKNISIQVILNASVFIQYLYNHIKNLNPIGGTRAVMKV